MSSNSDSDGPAPALAGWTEDDVLSYINENNITSYAIEIYKKVEEKFSGLTLNNYKSM